MAMTLPSSVKACLSTLKKGARIFIVDLGRVDYMDGSGLRTLINIQKMALNIGGGVIITGLHGLVKELFALTRLNRVFEIR